jgi:hypothetical protein
LHLSLPTRGKWLTALGAAVLALAAAAAFVLTTSSKAPADTNANNYDCRGSITKGAFDADLGETEVVYSIACNGPITGYQLQTNQPATGYDTEVFGQDPATKETIAADFFSCTGDIPGYGVNCNGTYNGNYEKIVGKYTIDGDICTEPRQDPLLTVVFATPKAAPATGVTQAISGPFEIGRPKKSGCKATALSGKTRIPQVTSESGDDTDIG